jgi:hypothetical protein
MQPYAFQKLGAIHEENPNLHPLGAVQAPVPKPATLLPDQFFALAALMQYQTPKCGGYSLAQLLNYLEVLSGSQNAVLSGNFDYEFEKTVDGVPDQDGTTISAIGKAGAEVGCCLINLFPEDTATTTDTTPYSAASEQAKIDALARIGGTPFLLDDLSIEGIHQAVYQNSAVILEVQVGDEWWTTANGETSWAAAAVLPIRPPKTVIDAHYILVGAYDETTDRTWFVNSWSNEWGQNGFGYFASNYAPFIKGGIAFKKVPASVQEALYTKNYSLAQQILMDISEALGLIKQELGQGVAKVGTL